MSNTLAWPTDANREKLFTCLHIQGRPLQRHQDSWQRKPKPDQSSVQKTKNKPGEQTGLDVSLQDFKLFLFSIYSRSRT